MCAKRGCTNRLVRFPHGHQLPCQLQLQHTFVLPHLFNLINNRKVFKLSSAKVYFDYNEVSVFAVHAYGLGRTAFTFYVICEPLDWQVDCAAQIYHALIPTLSEVKELWLDLRYKERSGAIDSATWHDLLRSFIGVKRLDISNALSEKLSRALQVDEIGSDPSFLAHLQSIYARHNIFTSFIDTRQVMGRPVQFQVAQWL